MSNNLPRLPAPVRHAFVAALAVLVLAGGACTGNGDGQSDSTTTTTIRVLPRRTVGFDGEVIRLGVMTDLSGPGRVAGRDAARALEAYWAVVNAAGGVDGRYQVELEVADTGGTPEGAAAEYVVLRDEVVLMAYLDAAAVTAVAASMASDVMSYSTDSASQAVADDPGAMVAPLPVGDLAGSTFAWRVSEASPAATWCRVDGVAPGDVEAKAGVQTAAESIGLGFAAEIEVPPEADVAAVLEALTTAGCREVWLGVDATTIAALLAAVPVEFDGAFSTIAPLDGAALPADAGFRVFVGVGGAEWDPAANPVMAAAASAAERYLPGRTVDDAYRQVFASQLGVLAVLEAAVLGDDLERPAVRARVLALTAVDTGGLVAGPAGPIRVFRVGPIAAEGDGAGGDGRVLVEEAPVFAPRVEVTTTSTG